MYRTKHKFGSFVSNYQQILVKDLTINMSWTSIYVLIVIPLSVTVILIGLEIKIYPFFTIFIESKNIKWKLLTRLVLTNFYSFIIISFYSESYYSNLLLTLIYNLLWFI